MDTQKGNPQFCGNKERLAREIETLSRMLRDYGCRNCATDQENDNHEPLVAVIRLCKDLPLEEWRKLSQSPDFEQWLALPVNGESYPHLLHLQERLENLSFQSEHDPLTELHNRRAFERILKLELQRATRQGHYLSLAVLDLDNFKKINDTYGHPCGDEVLVALAETLVQNKRTYDLAARLGGEEFALVLPGAGPSKAKDMISRLLQTFGETAITCTGLDTPIHATFSAGVAATRAKVPIRSTELMNLADKALYMAKEQGKNTVVVQRAPKELEMPKTTMVRSEEKQFLFTGK